MHNHRTLLILFVVAGLVAAIAAFFVLPWLGVAMGTVVTGALLLLIAKHVALLGVLSSPLLLTRFRERAKAFLRHHVCRVD